MKKGIFFSICVVILLSQMFAISNAQNQNWVTVYQSNWVGEFDMPMDDWMWEGTTHMIFFNIEPQRTPPYYYLPQGNTEGFSTAYQTRLVNTAHAHGVKMIMCIGGIGQTNMDTWIYLAADSARFETAIRSILGWVKSLNYDGVDYDLEAWVHPPLNDFARMARITRRVLNEWTPDGIMTIAAGRSYNGDIHPAWVLNAYFDQINPMIYDGNGAWSDGTGFHSPRKDPTSNYPNRTWSMWDHAFNSYEYGLNTFLAAGIPASKLSIPLGFYSWAWAYYSAPGQAKTVYFDWMVGFIWHYNITDMIDAGGCELHYDTLASQAWLVRPQYVGIIGPPNPTPETQAPVSYIAYDNERSMADKIAWAKSIGINNVMVFTKNSGFNKNKPAGQKEPLMKAVVDALIPTAPTITTHPSNTSAYVGATATFTVAATSSPNYQWQKNGSNIGGATSSTYTTPTLVLGDNGATFRCIATNSQGAATSTSATLTVSVPTSSAPSFLVQPINKAVLVGEQASFTVQVAGYPTPTYQWQRNGANISGATGSTYTTPVTVISDNGATFRCIATNPHGVATSSSATLTVSAPVVANPVSDDFSNTGRFINLWTKSHPQITSLVGLETSDAFLRLNLDGTTAHEMGNNDYSAVRVLQDITDGNFEVVAKFQTLPSAAYQWEGILVKEHATSFLRFDILKDNGGLKFFAGKASASSEQKILTGVNIPGPSAWVKVGRVGNVWTASYSADGSTFIQAGQFVQVMLVDSVGVYAGNQNGGSGVPAFDCKVDYFFNVGSPINPEDPIAGAPTGTFTVSSDTLPAGGGNVTFTWTSSNAVSASIDQGIGSVALNGSTTVTVGQTKSFTLTLTNALGSQSYVAGVFVALPGGGGNLQDITSSGTPVALITNPTGTGNRNLEIIRDGITPPLGSSNPNDQYDTYNGGSTRLVDWIGYTYSSIQSFGSIILQEGIHASEGGFFASTPRVEVRVGAQWIEVQGLVITPSYSAGSASNFAMYTLSFNAISGDGIRVAGTPGGTARYLSVAELRVMGTAASTVAPDNKPKDFDLLRNYPNPFNPSTTIEFWVPATSHVTLSVYNILGQKVRTLVDQAMEHGKWPVTWDGLDDQNRLMSSGVYIYRMQAGDFVATRKMILSK